MADLQRLVIRSEQLHPPDIYLSPEQQHYLGRVLRLKVGDRFIAVTQQQWWLAVLVEDSGGLQGQLLEAITVQRELPLPITLVAALPKGNGFDDVVRQATELGVAKIVPVISDRTLLQPSPQKLERWRRIAEEATEQAERQAVPTIGNPVSFETHLQDVRQHPSASYYLGATRSQSLHLLDSLRQRSATSTAIVIAIGPEGGWTEAEVDRAIESGYHPVSLGQRILRAITASVAALAIISAELESEKSPVLGD